jgi:hypothetical protein
MRRSHLLLFLALLWPVSTRAQSVSNIPAHIRTLAVVTVIPSKVHVFRWGFMDHACDWLDVTSLHLEKAAFDGVSRALTSKYRVVQAKVDRDAVIRTSNTEVMGAFRLFPTVGEQVRRISHTDVPVDAYLLIWSSHNANVCELRPGIIGYGVGLTKSLANAPNLHAFAGMSIIDTKTLETLKSRELRPSVIPLDGFEWKDSLAEMTAQQRQLITTLLVKLVGNASFATSKALFIGQQ